MFSAFYDHRGGRSVRVIGATKTRGPDRVWCRFWYQSVSANKTVVTSFSVPAHIKVASTCLLYRQFDNNCVFFLKDDSRKLEFAIQRVFFGLSD